MIYDFDVASRRTTVYVPYVYVPDHGDFFRVVVLRPSNSSFGIGIGQQLEITGWFVVGSGGYRSLGGFV